MNLEKESSSYAKVEHKADIMGALLCAHARMKPREYASGIESVLSSESNYKPSCSNSTTDTECAFNGGPMIAALYVVRAT